MTADRQGAAPLRLEGVPAPAKLNLFLHVTGRRSDGYHLLQSVFMLIDWSDTLDLERRPDGQITREDVSPGSVASGLDTPGRLPAIDLTVRAAQALKAATGCPWGVHIRLTNRIPAEAGLGGGSSDAASCLLALNRLWDLRLRRNELIRIGQQLGADVPFFLGGRNAWVEGVGERLTPVTLPGARYLVVKPPSGASTQRIFSAPSLKRDTQTAIIQGFAVNDGHRPSTLDLLRLQEGTRNDLQPVAQALCPEVGECLAWLSGQGLHGRMTGSGTAVFAPLPAPWSEHPSPAGWTVRACSNLDVHPLIGWCSD